jgi:hypothetical protein
MLQGVPVTLRSALQSTAAHSASLPWSAPAMAGAARQSRSFVGLGVAAARTSRGTFGPVRAARCALAMARAQRAAHTGLAHIEAVRLTLQSCDPYVCRK